MSKYAVTDPATGQIVQSYVTATDQQVWDALRTADGTQKEWTARSIADRAAVVRRVGQIHGERAAELGAIMVREMGKPLAEAVMEAEFAGAIYEYYADLLSTAHRQPNGQLELDGGVIGHLFDEIRDPEMQKLALRSILDIVNADRQLNGREARLVAQAFQHWEIERHEVPDTSLPGRHHLPLAKPAEIHLSCPARRPRELPPSHTCCCL